MGDSNCYTCDYCLSNCTACPDGNITRLSNGQIDGGNLYTQGQGLSVLNSRKKRIWKQSRMSSSQGLLKRKTMMVSKQVGQGACPTALGEAGGPGDLQSAIQKSNYPPAVGRAACYNMGHLRNRVAYRNNVGVDRKHDSYQRYLARRVGGVFRKEKMPNIVGRTSYRGQPRTRTGSKACCKRPTTSKWTCPTITVGHISPDQPSTIYGWTAFDITPPYTGQSDKSCVISNLTALSWDNAPVTPRFLIQFGGSNTLTSIRSNFISITIRDQNGNSITYTQGNSTFEPVYINPTRDAGYTWANTPMPSWIRQGTVIEVFFAGVGAPQCCENRIPNCSEQSKFTGMGKTRNANGELVGPGNVKNRTCVAQRCQCPNCPKMN